MTDPKRMTAERIHELERIARSPQMRELLAALSAERAYSAKVEARCEELRQLNILHHPDGLTLECALCGGVWRAGHPENHGPTYAGACRIERT